MRDRVFYSICFGFVFGVLLRSFIFVDLYFALLFSGIFFTVFLFFKLVSKRNWGIIASIFVLAFCLGILRFHTTDKLAPSIFSAKGGPAYGWEVSKIELTGIIIDEPVIGENNQKLN